MARMYEWTAALVACATSVAAQECAVPRACVPTTCAPPQTAGAPAPPQNPGRFVRGAAPGTTSGESNSLGIRGPALHIPELRLQLPHLELPGLYKIRTDASKTFDATRSPLIEEALLELDNVAGAPATAGAPAPPPPTAAPAFAPACTPNCVPSCIVPGPQTSTESLQKALAVSLARMEAMEREIATLKQQTQAQSTPATTSIAAPLVANGALKPSSASRAVVPASRPAPAIKRASAFETASYQEEVDERVPARSITRPTPVRTPQLRGAGLSSPSSAPALGEWEQKR